MNKLKEDISNYKVFCLVRRYKENDAKALKEYIELRKTLKEVKTCEQN